MRQSFSSASCAATDSPCAVNTTLQCVVANATDPFCPFPPTPVNDVTSSGTPNLNQSQAKKQACDAPCRATASLAKDNGRQAERPPYNSFSLPRRRCSLRLCLHAKVTGRLL